MAKSTNRCAMLLAAILLMPAVSSAQMTEAQRGAEIRKSAPARVARVPTSDRALRAPTPDRASRAPAADRASRVEAARASRVPATARPLSLAARSAAPIRLSVGQATGLHNAEAPLSLRSAVAFVIDQRTEEILLAKNPDAVLPIASITKLMTALVVIDAAQPMDEILEIGTEDIDTEKGSRSRLRPGTRLSRAELLQLALMASENRAAHALGRHYTGGLPAFVLAMNEKARQLGMVSSRFSDPTGLSDRNVANARDLARMLKAAYEYPLIRRYSTAPGLEVDAGRRSLGFRNTNRLIENAAWSIGLQKTGYIAEAGRCLVMQATLESRPVLMVLLDSAGKNSRFGDAQRIRDWLDADARRGSQVRVRQAAATLSPAVPSMVATRF